MGSLPALVRHLRRRAALSMVNLLGSSDQDICSTPSRMSVRVDQRLTAPGEISTQVLSTTRFVGNIIYPVLARSIACRNAELERVSVSETENPKTESARRPASIRFSLRAMIIFTTALTVLFAILFQLPHWLAVQVLVYAMISIPAPLWIAIRYSRGILQSFFVGTMLPALVMVIVAIAHIEYVWIDHDTNSSDKLYSAMTKLRFATLLGVIFALVSGTVCILTHKAVEKDE